MLTGVAKRRLTALLTERITEEPVVVLNGPRTVGKSTLLAQVATSVQQHVIDCDDPGTRAAVRNDPGVFVARDGLVVIDEYQHVPELLDAIKAELNRDLRPGRYLMAGSTRYGTIPQAGQALTGRVDIVPVLPLSQAEIDGTEPGIVQQLLDGETVDLTTVSSSTDREEYARRITAGGMPVPLRRPPGRSRSRWFANYIDLVVERDVLEISRIRQRDMMPRLLRQLAARTGQVLNISTAAQSIGMEKSTAENYLQLLEAVFLVQRLPSWGSTLGTRIGRQPKIHLVDSGVAAWLLGVTPERITQGDPTALAEYGHLTETFAVGEISKHLSVCDTPVRVGHFRTGGGDEVDLIVETDDGRVLAFEIKAGTRIHGEDLKGIRTLRNKLGNRLTAVFFYTGAHAFRHEEGALVLPLDTLW